MKAAAALVIALCASVCIAQTPLFTLRTRAPQPLCEKALRSADAVGARSHLRLFFYFKFATLGYPNFECFDSEAPLVARVYERANTQETFPILFVKSPAPERLVALFGATAAKRMRDGWLAIDPLGNAADCIETLAAHTDLAEIAQPPRHDVELSAHPFFHLRARRLAEAAPFSDSARALLQEITAEAASLRSASLALDFDETLLTLALELQAAPDTPPARLFNAKSGGDVEGARALAADAPVGLVFKIDRDALGAYSDGLFERFQRRFDGVQADALENFSAFANALLRTQNGGSAANYALRNLSLESETVYDGYCESAVLRGLLARAGDLGAFMGDFTFVGEAPPVCETQVESYPIDVPQTDAFRVSFVVRERPAWNPQDPSSILRIRAQITERYVAAAARTQIATTRPEDLRAIARRLVERKFAPNNLHDALGLPLESGEFMRGKIETPLLLRDWFFHRAQSARKTPLSFALEKLSFENVAPARLRGVNGSDRLLLTCEIPFSTLLRLAETLREGDIAF